MKKLAILVICISMIMCTYAVAGPNTYKDATITSGTEGITTLGGTIIGAIRAVGIIVSVAVLIYVGIRFMLASPGAKADLKTSLIPYVVGAVLVFGTTQFVNIIYQLRME